MIKRNNCKYVIATIKSWNINEARKFASMDLKLSEVLIITDKKELAYHKIKSFNPDFIFFPHWSWLIPRNIYENYECIVFHMTDLPFGRGGSPLQNLIARGIKKTKISAIKTVEEIDAGPVYLKRDLDLHGTAGQIFKRASKIIFRDMIQYILTNNPDPILQKGKVIRFKRRVPEQSNVSHLKSIREIYDHIRMLDAEGYPPAYIETAGLKIEFKNAIFKKSHVLADVEIKAKGK